MPLFKKKLAKNPRKAAIPDFTDCEKMKEHVKSLSGDERRGFQVTLNLLKHACHNRWVKVTDELEFMKWYEQKQESGEPFETYCIVKWSKNYPSHLAFISGAQRKYMHYKHNHELCQPGQGFYMYDEPLKYLLKWINNIIDPGLLMRIQECCIVGMQKPD
jgi:hypothetical protein